MAMPQQPQQTRAQVQPRKQTSCTNRYMSRNLRNVTAHKATCYFISQIGQMCVSHTHTRTPSRHRLSSVTREGLAPTYCTYHTLARASRVAFARTLPTHCQLVSHDRQLLRAHTNHRYMLCKLWYMLALRGRVQAVLSYQFRSKPLSCSIAYTHARASCTAEKPAPPHVRCPCTRRGVRCQTVPHPRAPSHKPCAHPEVWLWKH